MKKNILIFSLLLALCCNGFAQTAALDINNASTYTVTVTMYAQEPASTGTGCMSALQSVSFDMAPGAHYRYTNPCDFVAAFPSSGSPQQAWVSTPGSYSCSASDFDWTTVIFHVAGCSSLGSVGGPNVSCAASSWSGGCYGESGSWGEFIGSMQDVFITFH
jgi:hypothetical protein